ncbi:hypothetical protein KP509_20G024600 [Ceratopteris richardii]|uniref:Uncharacterized protein n=1 Tax=Ceratopteris richardii TaxID=49495 RepID=A0A8T2SDV5_CERRI|nr:hypothetical protein KP509_20G024600 [Ceratopteris richardii]
MQTFSKKVTSRITSGANAVSDTYFSIKDVFERHKVVLTLAASLASAGAAWAGYTARQIHQKRVEARLDTIEKVMTRTTDFARTTGVSYIACAATAGTTLVIGYGLGWRGGRSHMIKKLQKQQKKLLAPKKSTLSRFKTSFRLRNTGTVDMKETSAPTKEPSNEAAKSIP